LPFLGKSQNSSTNTTNEKKEAKQDQAVAKVLVIPPRPDDEAKAKFYDRMLAFVQGQVSR
jgi:hypothetical protein